MNIFEEAKEWFNTIDPDTKGKFVIMLHKLSKHKYEIGDKDEDSNEENILETIERLEYGIKQKEISINELIKSIKSDKECIELLRRRPNKIKLVKKSNEKDMLISHCKNLLKLGGDINKHTVEEICKTNEIPIRLIRDIGGIKTLRKMILESKDLVNLN